MSTRLVTMLERQQKLLLSEHMGLYDIIISKDHWIRELHDIIDYEFIYESLKDKYCLDNGAMAYDPIMLFKLLMLKSKFELSDRDLMERAQTDMAIKYFVDVVPEEQMPHHTLLTKFRKLRLNDENFMSLLISKTVEVARVKELLKSKTIIVDSTHTKSVYNPKTPIEILQEQSKKVRKAVYDINESYKEKMPPKPTSSDLDGHIKYCEELIKLLKSDETLSFYQGLKEKIIYKKL